MNDDLSSKKRIFPHDSGQDSIVYPEKDVREFIRKLKDERCSCKRAGKPMSFCMCHALDRLAGKELTEDLE